MTTTDRTRVAATALAATGLACFAVGASVSRSCGRDEREADYVEIELVE